MELRDSNSQASPIPSGPPSSVTALIQNITSNMSVFGYTDEYDPLKPNDYEKLKEQYKREQIQRDRELENQRVDENEPKRGLYDDYENEEKEFHDRPTRKGNTFAPPPSLIEEDKRASTTTTTNSTESGIFDNNQLMGKSILF
jgi:hypothetical protein